MAWLDGEAKEKVPAMKALFVLATSRGEGWLLVEYQAPGYKQLLSAIAEQRAMLLPMLVA